MIWGIFCIIFILVIVIYFYPKSYNSKGVLSLYSEKACKTSKQDITWRIRDMKIEVQWFLEDIWRQDEVKKIDLKFQGIKRQKNASKRAKNYRKHSWVATSCSLAHGTTILAASWSHVHQSLLPAHGHKHKLLFTCFPSYFWWKTPIFNLLTCN